MLDKTISTTRLAVITLQAEKKSVIDIEHTTLKRTYKWPPTHFVRPFRK